MKKLYIGTSGYNYKEWKKRFYPEKLPQTQWLSYYSEHFSTVELNATFYGSFSLKTYEKWRDMVPEDFHFTIKGSRFITHIRRIKDVGDSVGRLFESAAGLEEKLKIVLWQFPRSFSLIKDKDMKIQRFERFLFLLSQPSLTRTKDIKQVFEFRHDSWFVDEVFALLDTYKAGFVINDSPAFPSVEKVTGGVVYIRFHGPGKLYATSYNDEQLKVWAGKIKKYF